MSGLAYGPHAARPVAGLASGDLYLCTTHRLVYQTVNGGRDWASWGDLMEGGGGGGVSVDNTVDPPTTVTSLVIPGADVSGDTATVLGLRLIGPFTVNFDDSVYPNGLYSNTSGKLLATIPVGAMVLDIWAALRIPFEVASGSCTLQVRLGDRYNLYDTSAPDLLDTSAVPGNEDDFFDIVNSGNPWSVSSSHANGLGRAMPVFITGAGGTPTPAAGGTGLSARVNSSEAAPSAGQFDVYAIVAYPAS